jgi:hypothetical protein
MPPLRIVLNIHGGLVQEVFSTAPDVQVAVVDWDVSGPAPGEPDLVLVPTESGVKKAYVCQMPIQAWSKLDGADVDTALRLAGHSRDSTDANADAAPLSAHQLATVLASLRHWQEITRQAELGETLLQYIPANLQLHCMEHGPLSHAEIDELCEQLNCNPDAVSVRQEPCECQTPGYYCSGVPGILAHLQDDRLAPGAKVERCELCRRFLSDEAALARLRELGLA